MCLTSDARVFCILVFEIAAALPGAQENSSLCVPKVSYMMAARSLSGNVERALQEKSGGR